MTFFGRFYQREGDGCQAELFEWHGRRCARKGVVLVRGRWVCKQHARLTVELAMRREQAKKATG